MPINFRSKSFNQTSVNNAVVKQRGYDVAYDGEKAVIDALKNGELFRYEMDKDEFVNLMKKYSTSNRSGARSINDTLMRDFNIDKTRKRKKRKKSRDTAKKRRRKHRKLK